MTPDEIPKDLKIDTIEKRKINQEIKFKFYLGTIAMWGAIGFLFFIGLVVGYVVVFSPENLGTVLSSLGDVGNIISLLLHSIL